MNSQILQEWFEEQLPVLESFLKTILLKKINTEISAASISDTDLVIEALKTGTVLASSKEPNYDKSIYIAYDENWIPQLSKAMLGMEEEDVNEVTNDLIKEFTSQLLGTAQAALDEQGAKLEAGDVELIRSGQITNSIDEGDYFMVQIDVDGKFEIEGDDQPELAMIVAFEIPDDEAFQNFFANYEDIEIEENESTEHESDGDDTDEMEMASDMDKSDEDAADTGPKSEQDNDDQQEVEESAKQEKPNAGNDMPVKERDPDSAEPSHAKKVEFEDYAPGESQTSDVEVRNLDRLKDVELDISVELGRKQVELGTILRLVRGSVIELDKLAGEPVEVYANSRRIAEGEVIVIDEHFGVRITNLVSTRERIESLR